MLQQILNGLTLGGIYALIALGYTMSYGIIKLINFAHGDIFMVGAFAGLFVIATFTSNFLAVIVIAMAVCALLGFIVEKTAYIPLREGSPVNMIFTAFMLMVILLIAYLSRYHVKTVLTSVTFWVGLVLFVLFIAWLVRGRIKSGGRTNSSRINALISAIGMSIIISNMVVIIYGPKRAIFPQIIKFGEINVGQITVSGLQIFIIAASVALMYMLYYIVHKTKVGIAMRAVSQNMDTARLMGINPNKVIGFTFALGASLAGAAGVLVGVFYTVSDPTMGGMYGMK
ncbi:MAG: branched-chain amino acid ABC transporter permease, partial [Deferribacteraceae bacterium]|nr:branched-chain amino acid ABC transporter permease [Deferribacteraceae bacterium]